MAGTSGPPWAHSRRGWSDPPKTALACANGPFAEVAPGIFPYRKGVRPGGMRRRRPRASEPFYAPLRVGAALAPKSSTRCSVCSHRRLFSSLFEPARTLLDEGASEAAFWLGQRRLTLRHSFSPEYAAYWCRPAFRERAMAGNSRANRLPYFLQVIESMSTRVQHATESMELRVKRLDPNSVIPHYAHRGDAGLDLFSSEDIAIEPRTAGLVRTGIAVELPAGTEGQVRPLSGLALECSLTVLNSPGTIDEGYRGEICVVLINHGSKSFLVKRGTRIAQLVIQRRLEVEVIEVAALGDTSRGDGGFGSTG